MTPNNPRDLAKAIMEAIIETELKIPADQRMDSELIGYVLQEVKVRAEQIWLENLLDKRDTFLPTVQDLEEILRIAGEAYTEDLLNGLLDKGMVSAVVDESGEIMYKITEEGIKAAGIVEEEPTKKRGSKKKTKE